MAELPPLDDDDDELVAAPLLLDELLSVLSSPQPKPSKDAPEKMSAPPKIPKILVYICI